ncbi:MAG: bifunctional glutamate N-acetyltransferase/amino-acid acetyltransferase ArgJ [Christensenellaceae bacterium]|nr:bifunctional glutamate N-acetyltransferase/amino-acid acetyltransferase ArgJ [Christensenellaceae bacterium]
MNISIIEGGVTAPKGFLASGIHCGIRKNKTKKDLALIISDRPAYAAAVYTQNIVKGAPLIVTKKNIANKTARAVICNSGNANTCNPNGIEIAEKMCSLVATATGVSDTDVIVASTGVIGQPLDCNIIERAMCNLVNGLGNNSKDASEAIMTTDTKRKEIAVRFELDGKACSIGGIAKGSGMIHPNMATLLVFLTTDVAICPSLLQEAIDDDVKHSFNMVSIDGDTSTNDMMCILANGAAMNAEITKNDSNFETYKAALKLVTTQLCKMIAKDGEGAKKLIECAVYGGKSESVAKDVAKSVIKSSLLKAAIGGADANWGRVLCAIGYSGVNLDITKIDVTFKSVNGSVNVCKNGVGVQFDEILAREILLADEITIDIELNDGAFTATAWGCDLTEGYVEINGQYRS